MARRRVLLRSCGTWAVRAFLDRQRSTDIDLCWSGISGPGGIGLPAIRKVKPVAGDLVANNSFVLRVIQVANQFT
jgi:hypothetical protein